jgi:hypothetical protein
MARTSQCPDCDKFYTEIGIKLHRGKKRCLRVKAEIPMALEVKRRKKELEYSGKETIYKNVADALERRGLGPVCGLEIALTRFIDGQGLVDSIVAKEYWIHSWVRALWVKHSGFTPVFYQKLEPLYNMSPEDLQNAVGMLMLQSMRDT